MSVQKLQANRAAEVTPNNNANIPIPSNGDNTGCLLYVGGAGDIRVLTTGYDDVTFGSFPGGFFPVQVVRVFSTGTTATKIIALW
jgi:hypothetical protein